MKISIIILHYKNWNDTKNCLQSLKKSQTASFHSELKLKGFNLQVIVVDNERELTKKQVEKIYQGVILLKPKKNLGFAGGNNLAIKKILLPCENKSKSSKSTFSQTPRTVLGAGEYVMLLNNDAVVYKNTIKQLVKTAEEYLDVGIVGPTVKHEVKEKTFYDYGGIINWKLGKAFHINKKRNKDRELRERDFVSGCCMLVKREVFEKIGFLNEKYFCYLEDVEFCVRAKKAGCAILLDPKAKIFHKGSQSSSEWEKIKYSWRNSLRFCWKWVPFPWKLIALAYNFFFYPALFLRWRLTKLQIFC